MSWGCHQRVLIPPGPQEKVRFLAGRGRLLTPQPGGPGDGTVQASGPFPLLLRQVYAPLVASNKADFDRIVVEVGSPKGSPGLKSRGWQELGESSFRLFRLQFRALPGPQPATGRASPFRSSLLPPLQTLRTCCPMEVSPGEREDR